MSVTRAEVERAFAQFPWPTFAVDCDVEEDGADSYRVFLGTDRVVGPITVGTTAVQFVDGRIGCDDDAPKVWIYDTGFSIEVARQLAAALIAAADELDGIGVGE